MSVYVAFKHPDHACIPIASIDAQRRLQSPCDPLLQEHRGKTLREVRVATGWEAMHEWEHQDRSDSRSNARLPRARFGQF